ncbi:hypothetical protein CBF23_006090 [Marinomonas agarivorans]|nr:hypothetical protein CBF23_006090 [Marinomonas agarivorans]
MAKLVFLLKNVPDEEADDIRTLLTENEIEFYETSAGRWQISLAAIWVRHNQDYATARRLIEQDQAGRVKNRSQDAPFLDVFLDASLNALLGIISHAKQNPVESGFAMIAIAFVLGLSVLPFMI